MRIKPPAGTLVDYSDSITRGLVLAYPFLEGHGGTLGDVTSTRSPGTLSGCAWITGPYGPAIAFNQGGATNDQVSFGDRGFPVGTAGRSLTIRFRFTGASPGTSCLWNYGDNHNGDRWDFFYDSGGNLMIETTGHTAGFPWTADTNWHVWTAIFPEGDSVSSDTIHYLDGTKYLSTTGAAGPINTADIETVACLGNLNAAIGALPFVGHVDSLSVHSRALSDDEAKRLARDPTCYLWRPRRRLAITPLTIFMDSFGGFGPGTGICSGGYHTTNLDGTAGSGTWTTSNFTPIVSSANRCRRGPGGGGGDSAIGSGLPPTTQYDVEADLYLASVTGTEASRMLLLSHVGPGSYFLGPQINSGALSLAAGADNGGVTLAPHYTTAIPSLSAGDTLHAAIKCRLSGANLVVSFILTRNSDGYYLKDTAGVLSWQAGAVDYFTFTDTAPLAKGTFGISTNCDIGDSAGIHLDNFLVTDHSPSATRLDLTGPASGGLDIASTPFMVAPDGVATQTLTLSDGGLGGVFTPATLTWTADQYPKTFTYRPTVVGAITISTTGSTLTVAPTSLTYTSVEQAKVHSIEVDPSGNVLRFTFTAADGVTPANVSGVTLAGATYRVNGGSPIALADPVYFAGNASNWVLVPLGGAVNVYGLDDHGATLTPGGAWTERGVFSYQSDPGLVSGGTRWAVASNTVCENAFQETTTPGDMAAVATYHLTGLVAGTYKILINFEILWGPDRTTDAVYRVYDADGTTLRATFHLDQTARPSYDRPEPSNYHLTALGTATITGTGLYVKVSNNTGSGVVATDSVYADFLQLPAKVQPGDTVTVSYPLAAFVTTLGVIDVASGHAVTHGTDAAWMPFDAAAPHHLQAGYNKFPAAEGNVSLLQADRGRGAGYWDTISGTVTIDALGDLTTPFSGTAEYHVVSGNGSGDDARACALIPDGDTLTFEFHYTDPGGFPTPNVPGLVDFSTTGVSFVPPVPTPVHVSGTLWTVTQSVHFPAFVPLSLVDNQSKVWHPRNAYQVKFRTNALITGLAWYDGATMAADPTHLRFAHPAMRARLGGSGLGAIRYLDCYPTNDANIVNYSDFADPNAKSGDTGGKASVAGIAVTHFSPVDTTGADVDTVLTWTESGFDQFSWIKVVTATPHGVATGQRFALGGVPGGGYASTYGGTIVPGGAIMSVALDAVTLLMMCLTNPPHAGQVVPDTLAADHDVTGAGITLAVYQAGGVPFADCVKFSADVGVPPWVVVPHLASTAPGGCTETMADRVLTYYPAGKVYVQYSNEVWNATAFQHYHYFTCQTNRLLSLHNAHPGDPTYAADPGSISETYAELANRHQVAWRAKFVAAGRGDDLVWVMGGAQFNAGVHRDIAAYAFRHGFTFDSICPAAYNDYTGPPGLVGGDAAFARMDVDARLSAAATIQLDPATNGGTYNDVRAALDDPAYGGAFTHVRISAYEGGLNGFAATVADGGRDTLRGHELERNPRYYGLNLALLQTMERQGWDGPICRYALDEQSQLQGGSNWCDLYAWDTQAYDADDGAQYHNANPWDNARAVSMELAARRDFSAYSIPPAPPGARASATFHVSAAGSDAADGLTTGTAWQTLAHVNAFVFQPGDTLSFRAGDTFAGSIANPTLSGTSGSPVVVNAYGAGARPIVDAGAGHGLHLADPDHLTVSGVEFRGLAWTGTGAAAVPRNGARGIWLECFRTRGARLTNIAVSNCKITNFYVGIYLDCQNTSTVGFLNAAVTNNVIADCMFFGFNHQGYRAGNSGPVDQSLGVSVTGNVISNIPGDPNSGGGGIHGTFQSEAGGLQVASTTGFTISGNSISGVAGFGGLNTGLTLGGSTSIVCTQVRSGVISGNEVWDTRCIMNADGSAIDVDQDSVDVEVCFNLTYNNVGAAVQVGAIPTHHTSNVRIHHNLSYNDARGNNARGPSEQGAVRIYGNTDSVHIFNNTFVVEGAGTVGFPSCIDFEIDATNTGCQVVNNVLATTAGWPMLWANRTFSIGRSGVTAALGNCYDSSGAGLHIANDDGVSITDVTSIAQWRAAGFEKLSGSPVGIAAPAGLLNVAGFSPPAGGFLAGGIALATVTNFDLAPGSNCIGAGIDPSLAPVPVTIGATDFHGNMSHTGAVYDIGAMAYGTSAPPVSVSATSQLILHPAAVAHDSLSVAAASQLVLHPAAVSHDVMSVSATSQLVLHPSASANDTYGISASSQLILHNTVIAPDNRTVSAESQLVLHPAAVSHDTRIVSASSQLVLHSLASLPPRDLGRFQRGQQLPLDLEMAGLPDSPPIATITYTGDSSTVGSWELPITVDAAHFARQVRLGALPMGRFLVSYQYFVAGVPYASRDQFDVVGGGDSGGEVLSMYSYDRPEARYLLVQLGSGKIAQGANPQL